jgi:hypothetical protein
MPWRPHLVSECNKQTHMASCVLLHNPVQARPQISKRPIMQCTRVAIIILPEIYKIVMCKPMNKEGLLYLSFKVHLCTLCFTQKLSCPVTLK